MPIQSLEDMTHALSQHPQSAEILEFVNAAIENEKTTGIKLKNKVNAEAQGLRKWKQQIESLGYEADDPEGIGDWLKSKLTTAVPDSSKPNPEIEKLRKEFAKAQKALEESNANAAAIKLKADRRAMKSRLTEALRDKVYGHDLLADTLINNQQVKLTEDESIVFVQGEDEIEFDKGLKRVLDARPDLLKNTQQPGAKSGSKPVAAKPVYSMEQIKAMSQEQIASDMENVQASMRAYKQ